MNATDEANNNEISEQEEAGEKSGEDGFVGTPVQRFYAGEHIFITGSTGFLGKILTEKLLRSCPDISRIYLLVRSKKGRTAQERIQDLFEEQIYEQMRNKIPDFRKKIVAVDGDCRVDGLALSEEDRNFLLNNVSIVFHLAATVRFDEKLKCATATNVRCTADVLDLCKRMEKLKSFVHVSTAYANCHTERIEERFYDYPIRSEQLLALADVLSESAFDEVTSGVLKKWPNTYTFTKAIAEDLIRENNNNLPIGIFRPAIVTSSAYEPIVGWVDNLYGPTGVVAAAASGILKTLHCDPDILANIVPVDITVNALIASAWDVAKQKKRNGKSPPIYNFVSTVDAPLTWREFSRMSKMNVDKYPLSCSVWYNSFKLIKSRALYMLTVVLIHFLPALLIDTARLCAARKPSAWKICGKIHKFSNVISYFCVNGWAFSNDNVRAMWLRLNEKDQQLFRFNMEDFDWETYFRNYVLGIRAYLFKEDPANLAASRIRANRLYWLDRIVRSFLILVTGWLVYSTLSAVFL